jgi:hypothetical protein
MRFLFRRDLWRRCEHSSIARRVLEDFKAWRRGEVRIAPGQRGRVYARKSDLQAAATVATTVAAPVDEAPATMTARREPTATMRLEVIRADGTREPGPTINAVVTKGD